MRSTLPVSRPQGRQGRQGWGTRGWGRSISAPVRSMPGRPTGGAWHSNPPLFGGFGRTVAGRWVNEERLVVNHHQRLWANDIVSTRDSVQMSSHVSPSHNGGGRGRRKKAPRPRFGQIKMMPKQKATQQSMRSDRETCMSTVQSSFRALSNKKPRGKLIALN